MPASRFHPLLRLFLFALGAVIIVGAIEAVIFEALQTAARGGVARGGVVNPVQFARDWITSNALWITLLSYPPLLVWLWFCRRVLDRRSMASLGLRSVRRGRLFAAGALGGAGAIALLFGALWLCGGVRITGFGPEAFDATSGQIATQLFFYAATFGAVGFMEELIFRGYGLHNIAAFIGPRSAIWVQAILFALIHLGNVGAAAMSSGTTGNVAPDGTGDSVADALRAMPAIALAGWFFALTYLKTGSLWFAIGFHAAWNFFLGCVFSLPVSGLSTFRLLDVEASPDAWLSGGSFGAEGSALLPPILLALIWLLRAQPDHPQATLDLSLLDPNARYELLPPPEPAAVPQTPLLSENESGEPRQSRFRTSMRARDDEPAWTLPPGQIRAEPETRIVQEVPIAATTGVAVESETVPQSTLEPALTAPSFDQSTLAPTPQPIEAEAPVKAEAPTSLPSAAVQEPTTAPLPASSATETPAPAAPDPSPKKPAPRW